MGINSIQNNPYRDFLNEHLARKCVNHLWLQNVLDKSKNPAHSFPYQVDQSGKAKIENKTIVPKIPSTSFPTCLEKNVQFLINIPFAHLPLSKEYEKLTSLLERLRTESFGKNPEESTQFVRQKLAVVIGVNQIISLDAAVNRAFINYIRKIPKVDDLPHRIFGFFWNPSWKMNSVWYWKASSKKRLYSKEQAFLLVKCLNSKRASLLRKQLETNSRGGLSQEIVSQIPYQKIRQFIKNSAFTFEFANKITEIASMNPVYFVTMDGDLKKLKTTQMGYFSHYIRLIQKFINEQRKCPSVISLGYQLDETALPIARLAVRCDMKVRDAMNSILKGSVYFPEPGTAYYLSNGQDCIKNLKKVSFISRKSSAEGFESRRVLANGQEDGIFNKRNMVFFSRAALITDMPGRMRTKTTEKYKELNPEDLKKQEVLKALRGVSQVHFSPLDWAHYVYEGLPNILKQGIGVHGKISGILSRIFAVFDPLSLIFNYDEMNDVYFKVSFDRIFSIYEKYVTALHEGEKNNQVKIVDGVVEMLLDKELEEYEGFINGQFLLLLSMKKGLIEEQFTEEWIRKTIDAAHASGRALFMELSKFLS